MKQEDGIYGIYLVGHAFELDLNLLRVRQHRNEKNYVKYREMGNDFTYHQASIYQDTLKFARDLGWVAKSAYEVNIPVSYLYHPDLYSNEKISALNIESEQEGMGVFFLNSTMQKKLKHGIPPKIKLDGTRFIIDGRSEQLIQEDNVQNRISYSDMLDLGTHYELKYNPLTKNKSIDDQENSLTIKIPRLAQSDPIGFAERYHLTLGDTWIQNRSDRTIITSTQEFHRRMVLGELPCLQLEDDFYNLDMRTKNLTLQEKSKIIYHIDDMIPYQVSKSEEFYVFYNPAEHKFAPHSQSTLDTKPGYKAYKLPPIDTWDPIAEKNIGIDSITTFRNNPGPKELLIKPIEKSPVRTVQKVHQQKVNERRTKQKSRLGEKKKKKGPRL